VAACTARTIAGGPRVLVVSFLTVFVFPSKDGKSKGLSAACATIAQELVSSENSEETGSPILREECVPTDATLHQQCYICSNPHCRHEAQVSLAARVNEKPRCVCGGEMKRTYLKPQVWKLTEAEADVLRKFRVLE
jgi:hypothetical protein